MYVDRYIYIPTNAEQDLSPLRRQRVLRGVQAPQLLLARELQRGAGRGEQVRGHAGPRRHAQGPLHDDAAVGRVDGAAAGAVFGGLLLPLLHGHDLLAQPQAHQSQAQRDEEGQPPAPGEKLLLGEVVPQEGDHQQAWPWDIHTYVHIHIDTNMI
jgi:hypothetical protein